MNGGDHADVLILGGGTAACVLAARLSEDGSRAVCLVEGGPDYGSVDSGHWPDEMLDGTKGPDTHDWTDGETTLTVARVIGGCSAHNLCLWVHPAAGDWDEWATATGDQSWSAEAIAPAIALVEERMPLRLASGDRIDPWLATLMEAADELGLGSGADVNAIDQGVAPVPLNARGRTRWNAAFAYLDEARGRPNLRIRDRTLIDRVEIRAGEVAGVIVEGPDGRDRIEADRVVVCAGAYGSPAILLRSGIGPEAELARHGIEASAILPVGERLRDHFNVRVRYAPSEEMQRLIDEHARLGEPPFVSQGLLKGRSSNCPDGRWDLHGVILAIPAADAGYPDREGHVLGLSSSLVKPTWTGTVRLRDTAPATLPEVTPQAFNEAADAEAALDGLDLCRRLAETDAARGAWTEQLAPGPALDRDALRRYCKEVVSPYFHPVGTCAMGRPEDGVSTVDSFGRVHGVEGLDVCDASVIPTVPRANTNLPTLAIAERFAERFA